MNQNEFLQKLQKALGNDLDSSAVQENVKYYKDYIDSEIKSGRTEAGVIGELGDPWAIARGIIGAPGKSGQSSSYETEQKQSKSEKKSVFGLDVWWKKVLVVIAVIAVIGIIFSVLRGLVSLIMPLIVPVVIVVVIFRIIGRKK